MLNNDFSRSAENAKAGIFSVSGLVLSDSEKRLFQEANPFGFILFKRNCDSPKQLSALVQDLKSSVGRECPILIDQEGGRVQRLRPPHWRSYKPMKYYGDLYVQNPQQALEDLRFETLRLAEELVEVGINVNCAPTLDLFYDVTTEAIGDRAFSGDPEVTARLGLSVCRHLIKSGITPIIKHMPGHGRARVDSHHELPCVVDSCAELDGSDFMPFKTLAASDVAHQIWGMTAHIIYSDIDTDHPVSVSSKGIDFIRRTIGFQGFLVSDDLDMKALERYGGVPERAMAALKAGSDAALYCAGDLKIMEKLAENLPKLGKTALAALQNATEAAKVAV